MAVSLHPSFIARCTGSARAATRRPDSCGSRRAVRTRLLLPVLALSLAALWPAHARAQDAQPSGGENPPVRVARLAQIQGQVSIEPAGVNQWTAATDNYPMSSGDRLYAAEDARAELQLEQTAVRVWHLTDLTITNLTDTITQLGLAQGSLHVRSFGLTPGNTLEIDTPNGAITVVQPGDVRIDAYLGDGGTLVTVNSGAVDLSGPGLSQSLGAGQSMRLTNANPVQAVMQRFPGEDPFDAWSANRDRQMLASQTRRYVDPSAVGSDDLDQYGTWSQDPSYGPVWYPTTVAAGWVPYSMGRWVWVSPWGWTWVDAYPWGFAPFHYGRWAFIGSRWGWIPGPVNVVPVYSPALVGFVGGAGFTAGGVALSAWFPLGPGEPFYPWYHCTPQYFTQINITNIRRTTINPNNYYAYYHNRVNFQNIRYANRNLATVAIRQNAFNAGRAITPQTVIRPTRQQLERVQVIPHPFVAPSMRNLVPHPLTSVGVPLHRPLVQPIPATHATPAMPQHPTPMAGQQLRGAAPAYAPRTGAVSPRMPVSPVRAGYPPQRLLARTPPPAPKPTFAQREPAYRADPGRPLSPTQVRNISQGRPAGAARAQEFPPHPAWAPPARGAQGATPSQRAPDRRR
jgi:hypothetical protein